MRLNQVIERRLNVDQIQRLSARVTPEEVKSALFYISNKKAPGHDGFSATFFKRNWDYVGNDITEAVLEFFRNGKMLKAWNGTALALIPKIAIPNTMRDFRPIACCNVIYKCISKVLVHRLKGVMADLVGPNQSAFIAGRDIVDNVPFMQEIVRNYHKHEGRPKCAIKVDIQKAYDTIQWQFLFEVLEAMHFPSVMIKWIKECVRM